MSAMLLLILAGLGQQSGGTAARAERPRVIVSTVAPARAVGRAAERRPRVNFELTEYADEPSREMPFALDDAAAGQVMPHALAPVLPSPQAAVAPSKAAPQAAAPSCPCQAAPVVTYAAPAPVVTYAAPVRPTVRYIERETYDSPVTYSYGSQVIYESSPTFAAPQSSGFAARQAAPTFAAPQSSGFAASYGGGFSDGATPFGATSQGGGGSPIYIDARSTMEHGPRFGIGAGLFRSGNTERIGNGRRGGGGGLFGRRNVSGTSYDGAASFAAPTVCGPSGCFN